MSDAPLPRATQVLPAGGWVARTARDVVTLDFDDRFRRRRRYVGERGLEFLLDLEEATPLRDGDGLLLVGGGVVLVKAAPEAVVEVRAETPERLARLAWHLGNRHLPTEIRADSLLIRDDHVILAMLRGMGADARQVQAPFNPEGGAYGEHNRHHAHQHGHAHPHDTDHAHPHDHAH